ncbi:MAG: DUF6165 family protein [Pseudomonadota bacterium]|nr:DUF6165 family protein [Pseudomonadota bacterium]
MAMSIKISVGVGELIDKITILEIKQAKISKPEKLKNINHELSLLNQERSQLGMKSGLEELEKALKEINLKLWDIEDEIRLCESRNQFDEVFIKLARSVYITNDKRCEVKFKINELFGSEVIEEKSYEPYEVS